jgi:hypothetical protein
MLTPVARSITSQGKTRLGTLKDCDVEMRLGLGACSIGNGVGNAGTAEKLRLLNWAH